MLPPVWHSTFVFARQNANALKAESRFSHTADMFICPLWDVWHSRRCNGGMWQGRVRRLCGDRKVANHTPY